MRERVTKRNAKRVQCAVMTVS